VLGDSDVIVSSFTTVAMLEVCNATALKRRIRIYACKLLSVKLITSQNT